jgi:hypothetical protein
MKKVAEGRKSQWRLAELKQLGRLPDSVLARRTGRTISEVVAMREARRLRLPTPPRRWTARETKLLGRYTDAELARRLARTKKDVWRHRVLLHIPPLRPRPRFKMWKRAEERLLGTMSEAEVARRTGHPVGSVLAHRNEIGLSDPTRRRLWTAEEDQLLGTKSDRELVPRLRRSLSGVKTRRLMLGIPAFGNRRRSRKRGRKQCEIRGKTPKPRQAKPGLAPS